MVYRIDILIGE